MVVPVLVGVEVVVAATVGMGVVVPVRVGVHVPVTGVVMPMRVGLSTMGVHLSRQVHTLKLSAHLCR